MDDYSSLAIQGHYSPVLFVFATGGPTNIDSHIVDMANQLDRSEGADVRGVKGYQNPPRGSGSAVPRRSSQLTEVGEHSKVLHKKNDAGSWYSSISSSQETEVG